jgi:hypothetical protein
MFGIIQLFPKAADVQTNSVLSLPSSPLHTTGIIGMDHNALVAKFLTP